MESYRYIFLVADGMFRLCLTGIIQGAAGLGFTEFSGLVSGRGGSTLRRVFCQCGGTARADGQWRKQISVPHRARGRSRRALDAHLERAVLGDVAHVTPAMQTNTLRYVEINIPKSPPAHLGKPRSVSSVDRIFRFASGWRPSSRRNRA